MPLRKAASSIFFIFFPVFLTHAAAQSAGGSPPAQVSTPAASAARGKGEQQPQARSVDLEPARNSEPNPSEQASNPVSPAARKAYQALIKRESERNGLPPDIADAVAAIESGYDPSAVGDAGEIGMMQVMPGTAAMLGFKGSLAELAKPDINIHYGVTYLGQAWRLANGDLCRALMKYRAGHGEETMSALSANYCGRARAHLAATGSPFAEGMSVPFAFAPPVPRARAARRAPRYRTAAVSRAFWAAEEARVRAISNRIKAKWRRMASR